MMSGFLVGGYNYENGIPPRKMGEINFCPGGGSEYFYLDGGG